MRSMRSMQSRELQEGEGIEARSPGNRLSLISSVALPLPSLRVNVLEQPQKFVHLVEARLEAGGATVVNAFQEGHHQARAAITNGVQRFEDFSPGVNWKAFARMGSTFDDKERRQVLSLGGREVLIDDEDATVVFVLRKWPWPQPQDNREAEAGQDKQEELNRFQMSTSSGSDDEAEPYAQDEEWIEKPFEKASELFRCDSAKGYLERELGEDTKEGVSKTEYLRAVRRVLAMVISHDASLNMDAFESFDEDMVFWKVTASTDDLQNMADMFQYKMPISEEAYKSVKKEPPGKSGQKVYAYAAYSKERGDDFQEFLSVDEVRLVVQQLNRFISLHALEDQQVIAMWFPAAKFTSMQKLHEDVVMSDWAWLFMSAGKGRGRADVIREYFGEEIAFFFSFYEHYKYYLAMLCIPAALVTVVNLSGLERIHKNMLNSAFGIVVALWALVVRLVFHHRACKDAQRWGMDAMRRVEVDLPSWNPKLVGSWYLWRVSAMGHLVTILFLVAFVVLLCVFSFHIMNTTLRHRLQTVLTFVFGYWWSKIAHWIAKQENFRTQSRFNTALTKRLAYVKLFLYLFPLMKLAFMSPLTERICGDNMQAALANFQADDGFDKTLSAFQTDPDREGMFQAWAANQTISNSSGQGVDFLILKTLERVWLASYNDSQVCLRGCMPAACAWVPTDGGSRMVVCDDSCNWELQLSLLSLFAMHCALTFIFIAWPMIQVKGQASKELRHQASSETENPRRAKEYTLLQFQEKCYDNAKYDYLHWGGSYVEDFLELVLNFAVIATFGIICPPMLFIALPLQVAEYRLLAYRMTWVTCRPFPNAADGIGKWDNVLEVISYCAVIINALLVVSTMRTRLDTMKVEYKILFVCGWTLVLQTIKMIIQVVLHDEPRQCLQNADEHHDLHEALRRRNWSETAKGTKEASEPALPPDFTIGVGDD